MDCSHHAPCPGENTGVGCLSLLQGICLTQGSNRWLLHWQVGSFPMSHQGSPVQLYILTHTYVCVCACIYTYTFFFIYFPQWFITAYEYSSLTIQCCAKSLQSSLLATPGTVAHQDPLPIGFSRRGYWSRLPCPPPGDLPNPGIEPSSLASPALAGGFSATITTWEAPMDRRILFFVHAIYKSLCLLTPNSHFTPPHAPGSRVCFLCMTYYHWLSSSSLASSPESGIINDDEGQDDDQRQILTGYYAQHCWPSMISQPTRRANSSPCI